MLRSVFHWFVDNQQEMKAVRLKHVLPLVVLAVAIATLITYEPPLLRTGTSYFPVKLIDFLGFGWHHNLAFWYEALGDSWETRREYLLSGWHRPNYLKEYLNTSSLDLRALSLAFEDVGEYQRAAILLQNSVSLEGGQPEDLRRLGRLFLKCESYGTSVEAYEQAIRMGASDATTFEDLGRSCEKLGQLDKALQYYRQAVNENPSSFRALAGYERLGPEAKRQAFHIKLEKLATREIPAQAMLAEGGGPVADGWSLWTICALRSDVNLLSAPVRIRVFARGIFAGGDWPDLAVSIDRREIGRTRVDSPTWQPYEFTFDIKQADRYELAVKFLNDFYREEEDRNLDIQKVQLVYY